MATNTQNVLVMIGLPGQGKSYIANKLSRYFNWIGISSKAFQIDFIQDTIDIEKDNKSQYFLQDNNCKTFTIGLINICNWLNSTGSIAILDAPNITNNFREAILDMFTVKNMYKLFFIECICDDEMLLNLNITNHVTLSATYSKMDKVKAIEHFKENRQHYQSIYETLNRTSDSGKSYVKIYNFCQSFYAHNLIGYVQSKCLYFLTNLNPLPRSFYLCRHGESEENIHDKLGVNGKLSKRGLEFAKKLKKYFEGDDYDDDDENDGGEKRNKTTTTTNTNTNTTTYNHHHHHHPPLNEIWTSQMIRTKQTAEPIKSVTKRQLKELNELSLGQMRGMSHYEISQAYPEDFAQREKDKYNYRYPNGGESYDDVVRRLEAVLMDLERVDKPVLVVCHLAVGRCILGYFLNKSKQELPHLDMPLHTVMKLTPCAFNASCDVDLISLND